ncbi:MAG: tRNA pseudouridine(55) synthase TruB [Bacteroidetes bacterium]|nr:tRNA pseudouridine(55) synthase TruB [Bacteroidota bacterium]
MTNNNGILLYAKPAGVTSFSALYPIKKKFQEKTGHAGTLDKFAEGLLIVLLGKYTKLNSIFSGLDKVYEAVFHMGVETDTLDPEGKVVNNCPVPDIKLMESIIGNFIGKLQQVPPAYSAIHVNGKRAYQEIRNGRVPNLIPREISVYDFTLVNWKPPFLQVRIHCSKGTYIRSLARDFGKACGSAAYVCKLSRTSIGSFSLENAATEDNFSEKDILQGCDFFRDLPGFHIVEPTEYELLRLKYGTLPKTTLKCLNEDLKNQYCVFQDKEGKVAGVSTLITDNNVLIPKKLLFSTTA